MRTGAAIASPGNFDVCRHSLRRVITLIGNKLVYTFGIVALYPRFDDSQ